MPHKTTAPVAARLKKGGSYFLLKFIKFVQFASCCFEPFFSRYLEGLKIFILTPNNKPFFHTVYEGTISKGGEIQ